MARNGWVAQAFAGNALSGHDAGGLVLGGEAGPLAGDGRFSAMREEDLFLETVSNLPGKQHASRRAINASPLEHVLSTYKSARATGEIIRRKLERNKARRWALPETAIGEQLRTTARFVDASVDVPVLKVTQNGYDTHDEQVFQHEALLEDLSQSIAAFAQAARHMGLWNDITIVTYSEFGRTAQKNASGGTNHGTAAPDFVIGGRVKGGPRGRKPSLTSLVDGDLADTTAYRRIFGAILRDISDIQKSSVQPESRTAAPIIGTAH